MTPRAFFVTGTDTGVGKTWVSAALLRAAAAAGLRAAALKPAETGCEGGVPADATLLRGACGRDLPLDAVCPFRYREPVAPAVATELEGRGFDLALVRAALDRLRADADLVLVEGAGGLLCPFPDGLYAADVAEALALPLLVVARAGLGTVNHTLLTLAEARRRGLAVAGVVLSAAEPGTADPSRAGNPALIAERGRPPFVATADHGVRELPDLLRRLLADAEAREHLR